MPSKKKKYNARFPAGRIKKIMQTDEEVGKVAQAVPVIISRTLELFVESLLTKSAQITQARNAKTLTPSHMKQCILSENRFDFLKDLVKNIPDATTQEDNELPPEVPDLSSSTVESHPVPVQINKQSKQNSVVVPTPISSPRTSFTPNFYTEQGPSSLNSSQNQPTTVIQYGTSSTKSTTSDNSKLGFTIKDLVQKNTSTSPTPDEPKIHINLTNIIRQPCQEVPSLLPLARNNLYQGNNDNLCIDEDYDKY